MNDITIEIPIGGKPVKMTESEARELRARLNNLFGPEPMPTYAPLPLMPPLEPRPPFPWWKPGDVWCGTPVPADDPTRKAW